MIRPRVLVTTSTFPRWEGDGTPRFVLDLARIAARRCDVTVLAPGAPGARARESWDGVEVRRFRYFAPASRQVLAYGGGLLGNVRASWLARAQVPPFALAEAALTRRLARDADLIHAHWMLPQGAVAALVARRAPLVVSIHGSDLFALRGRALEALQRFVLTHAHVVTTNSDAVEESLLARHPFVRAKLVRLSMGYDESRFAPDDRARDPALIVFVGRLVPQKGADRVLAALSGVRARIPDARLVIVGGGPLSSEIAARAQALGVSAAVEVRGAIGHDALAVLLRRASLLVAPSRGEEGQGLAVIEAMASECPVLVTASGELGALVGSGERGVVACSPDDARALADDMVAALTDEAATRRRVAAASAWVRERYSWSASDRALFAAYGAAMEAASWD